MIFPAIKPNGLRGVTSNCSIVPLSFSLTIERQQRKVVTKKTIIPKSAGTMKKGVLRFGLNKNLERTSMRLNHPFVKLPCFFFSRISVDKFTPSC